MSTKSNKIRNIFLLVLEFLGLGAFGGGGVFIISPTGELMGMPVSELKNSPFTNFLIPGIILFIVLGLVPLLLIIALVRNLNQNELSTSIYLKICTGHGHSVFILLIC